MIGLLLKQEIQHTFQIVPAKCTAQEIVFLCPECGDKSGHRSVNLRTGMTFCFRCNKGANNKGNFLAWARALGFTFANATELSTVPLEQLFAETPPVSIVPVVTKVRLPRGFTPISEEPASVYTELITKMARRKNLDYQSFASAGVGFTRVDPRWEAFAIFPVVEYGIPVYYQGRTYIDVPDEPTKRFPSRGAVNYGAAFWIYNIDTLREQGAPIALVVESILNVLSLRKKFARLGIKSVVPVCVFKHHVSHVQLLKLLRCPKLEEICFLFDHDAVDQTWKQVNAITNNVALTVAEMPSAVGNKKLDANDDVDAAFRAFEQRRIYSYATIRGEELRRGRELGGMTKRELFDMTTMRFD
jgi:hypothetical protein